MYYFRNMCRINSILFLPVLCTIQVILTQEMVDGYTNNSSRIQSETLNDTSGLGPLFLKNLPTATANSNNMTEMSSSSTIVSSEPVSTSTRALASSTPVSPSPTFSGSGVVTNKSVTDLDISIDVNTLACGELAVCSNRITNSSPNEYFAPTFCYDCSRCYCDEQCSYFGDCCVDIVRPYSEMTRTWNCVERLTKYSGKRKYETAKMIQSCPVGLEPIDSEDVRRCLNANRTNREEVIPVTDMSTKNTYRNQFCARCNDVNEDEFWQIFVGCDPAAVDITKSKDQIWLDVLESDLCTIYDVPPYGIEPRSCLGTEVSSCDTSLSNNSVSQRLCKPDYGPQIEINGTVYLNVFCAQCNGIEIHGNCDPDWGGDEYNTPIFSLKVLLDFNVKPSQKSVEKSVRESKCNNDNVAYDPIMDSCSPILCAPRWDYLDGTCKPLFSYVVGLGFQLDLIVSTSKGFNETEIMVAEDEFEKQFKKSFGEAVKIIVFEGHFRKIRGNFSSEQSQSSGDTLFFGFVTSLQLEIETHSSQASVEQSLRKLANTSFEISVNNETIRFGVTSVNPCPANLELFLGTGHLEKEINDVQNPDNCPKFVCNMGYLPLFEFQDCPFIKVNLSSTAHKYDARNSRIDINNKTVQLRPNAHVYCDNVIQICVEDLPNIKEQLQSDLNREDNSAMAILSLVCISLSLVCLFITFVIFCIIPKLRTLPGKNTMALMFHLFCAQILFQTGIGATENINVCIAMAILIHYFWMTSFAWMAACAYHMWSTFSNISILISRGSHLKMLTKFMVVCHLVALTCVLACVGYNLGISFGSNTGYGGSICFLKEQMDIGIFFAAPLGIILVFNLACFLMTIRAIRAVPDMNSSSNQSNKNHVDVYFRLSILLGFTWVFGFIAAGLQSDTFWYIFIVLNGLQGVFISLAYCGTRRTAKLITDRFSQSTLTSKTQSSSLHDDSEKKQQRISRQADVQLVQKRGFNDRSLQMKCKAKPLSLPLNSKGGKSYDEIDRPMKDEIDRPVKDKIDRPMKGSNKQTSTLTNCKEQHENQTDSQTVCSTSGENTTESTHL